MKLRPNFDTLKDGADFKQWYWKKDELIAICKKLQLPYGAGKFILIDRIADHLDGKKYVSKPTKKVQSDFDWAKEKLTTKTVVTDSYKNNQNVRAFFKKQVGNNFSFSIDLMHWMKSNTGKTLGDAVSFYDELQLKKQKGYRQAIPDHNQYNAYSVHLLKQIQVSQLQKQNAAGNGRFLNHQSQAGTCIKSLT